MNPTEKARSIIANFSTNVFSIEGISKVFWREYKGCIPSVFACVEEMQEADQACFACLSELASPLSNRYHQQHEEATAASASHKPVTPSKGVSRLEEDILHLYIFSWSSESQAIQNTILEKYSAESDSLSPANNDPSHSNGLELLSSGEWLTNGGYSITEAPRKSNNGPTSLLKPFVTSAGPTVPHPGRTAAHQTPLFVSHASSTLATTQSKLRQNLTKLLFKSLEELFQRRLLKENFVRLAEYFILVPEQDHSESFRPQQSGCVGLRFKFFVSGDDHPVLAFHTKIIRTHLHALPSISSPWSIYHSNAATNVPPILVVTAPCGIAGYIANPAELSRNFDPHARSERDFIISHWKKLHHVTATSTVGVNIAGTVYQFPRSTVFLLSAPTHHPPPSLARHTIPNIVAAQPTPLQFYHEMHLQEFGSVSASSMQKTTLLDAIQTNWTIPSSENVIENIAAQSHALASSSIPWKPKKKGHGLNSQLSLMMEDDVVVDEFDLGHHFAPESLVAQPHNNGIATNSSGMGVVVDDDDRVHMDTDMPTTNADEHGALGEDPSASELDIDADVFDDRVAEDALVDDWGFTVAPPTNTSVKQNQSTVVASSVDPPVAGTPAPQETMYITTPGHLFSPGMDLHVRAETVTPFAVSVGATIQTPKDIGTHSSLPNTEGMRMDGVEMMDMMGQIEEDRFSDTSSHLSFSDEEEALVNRAWNHTLPVPGAPYLDVVPTSYKSLGLPPRSIYLVKDNPGVPPGSHSHHYSNMMEESSPNGHEEHNQDQGMGNAQSSSTGDNGQAMVLNALSDSDSDSNENDDDSETTTATAAESMGSSSKFLPGSFGGASASFNSAASIAQHLFDTHQEEPSTLFTGHSTSSSSFAPRSFALTAWARLSQFAAGDSARLCFASHLCNFFETTTGALIANYWPLLYNAEVFFKTSNSHQVSSLFMPSSGSGSNAIGLMHHHMQQLGHHHSVTRNDAISNTAEVILSETLDREAFNIHSPLQGFADNTWRTQSDLCIDVFRMYFKLDQTRLTLWHQAGGVASTPHGGGMPAITPNAMLTADEIFSAEWSSLSGTQIGPMSTEDWLHGRNPSFETSLRKPQFTSKWSGSFECSPFLVRGGNFTWPLEHTIRNTEQMFLLSQLSSEVFGEGCLGPGTRVSGPTSLPNYQQLLSGTLTSSSSEMDISASHMPGYGFSSHPNARSSHPASHNGYHSNSMNTHDPSRPETPSPLVQEVEVMTDPIAIVRYGEEGSMELPPTALYAWEKLNLRPLSPPKDVTFYVLAPIHVSHSAMSFFRQLSAVYTQCNLGSHSFDSALAETAGIVACSFPSGIETFQRQLQTPTATGNGQSHGVGEQGASGTTPTTNPTSGSSTASQSQSEGTKLAWGATAYSNAHPQQPTISPFAITEEQLKGFEEWAVKLAERLATTRQYNKSIIIYVVSPFTLESSAATFAGDARSASGAETAGLTRGQQLLAQRSAITLLRTVWAAVRKSNVRNLIVHGVSQNRVTAPIFQISHLKETAFNVYTKCRRVLLGEASRDQREPPKLYEPLFVLGKPSPNPSPILGAPPPSMLLPRDPSASDFTLHAAYVVTSRTMTWSLCDCAGEILECSTLPTYSTITLALVKLLEKIVQTLVDVGHKWRIVIGKWGILSPGELVEWQQTIKDYFVSKTNSQLVEQVALVSLSYASSLDIIPSSVFPIVPEQPLNASTSGPAQIFSDQRYSISQYGTIDSSTGPSVHPGVVGGGSGGASSGGGGSGNMGSGGQQFEPCKTIAVYDSKPDTDSWDNELLAQSHLVTFNPQWQHASLWATDCPVPLTTSLYQVFQLSQPTTANTGSSSSSMSHGTMENMGSTPQRNMGSHPSVATPTNGQHGNHATTPSATSSSSSHQIEPTTDPSVIHPTIRHITRHYHQLSWLNISPVAISRVDHLPIHFRLVRKLSNLHHAQSQP
jgi:hypothetical protein